MEKLERKWWFVALLSALSTIVTRWLTASAGMPPLGDFNVSQWLVYALCFGAVWKMLSFGVWLAVLCLRPTRV